MILSHKKTSRVFIQRRNNFLTPDTTCAQTSHNILFVSELEDVLDLNINFLNADQIGQGSIIKNYENYFTVKKSVAQIKFKMPCNEQNFVYAIAAAFQNVTLTTSTLTANLVHKATSSSTPLINYYNNEGRFYNILINNPDDPNAYIFQNCIADEVNIIFSNDNIPMIDITFISADYSIITKNFTTLNAQPRALLINANFMDDLSNELVYLQATLQIKNNVKPIINNLNKTINFIRTPELNLKLRLPYISYYPNYANIYAQKGITGIMTQFPFELYETPNTTQAFIPFIIKSQPKKYQDDVLYYDLDLTYTPRSSESNMIRLVYNNSNMSNWNSYI